MAIKHSKHQEGYGDLDKNDTFLSAYADKTMKLKPLPNYDKGKMSGEIICS